MIRILARRERFIRNDEGACIVEPGADALPHENLVALGVGRSGEVRRLFVTWPTAVETTAATLIHGQRIFSDTTLNRRRRGFRQHLEHVYPPCGNRRSHHLRNGPRRWGQP